MQDILNTFCSAVGTIIGCYIFYKLFVGRLKETFCAMRKELFERNKAEIKRMIEETLDEVMNEGKGE